MTTAQRPSGDRRGSVGDAQAIQVVGTGGRGTGRSSGRADRGSGGGVGPLRERGRAWRQSSGRAAYHRPTMADQLSLPLDATATACPTCPDLRPMLPRPLPEPFDSDEHLFEPWWGGVRALVFVGPADAPGAGDVRIVDADGVDRTAALPELAGTAVRVAARSAILDGELSSSMPTGGPTPTPSAARLAGERGPAGAFLAFDLLHLDGRSLLDQPLGRRREALRRVLRPGDEVVAVPAIATEGRALFEAIVAQGLAGMMARQRQGPYLPGVRSRLWRFIPAAPAAVPGAPSWRRRARRTGRARLARPRPVLALLSRLPLGRRRVIGPVGEPTASAWLARRAARPARRAAAMNARRPGPLAVEQDAGRVHPGRDDRDDAIAASRSADRQRRAPRLRRARPSAGRA